MTHDQNDKHKHKEKEEIPATAGWNHPISSAPLGESGEGIQESVSREVEAEKKEESVTIPLKEYAAQMKEIDDLKNKIKEFQTAGSANGRISPITATASCATRISPTGHHCPGS